MNHITGRKVTIPDIGHGRHRAAVIVTATESQARQACREAGFDPVIILSRNDCAGALLRTRRDVARSGASVVVVHSADWERQSLQPLFELAVTILPGRRRVILVGDGKCVTPVSYRDLSLRLGALPATCIRALATVHAEMRHYEATVSSPTPATRLTLDSGTVLAIWRGDSVSTTGGSVTHAAGMLGALRRQGLYVGLVTMCEPPPQLQAAVDDLEVAEALPRSARVTREIEDISLNRVLLDAGDRLLQRLTPAFIYQRYDSFITCGMELACRHQPPLVLEWNGSAAWDRRYWRTKQYRIKHIFDRFLMSVEEQSLRRSVLIRAVSDRAAEMAVECGAPPDRVVAISNAVDLAAIPPPSAMMTRNSPPVIGWVGSFGPWHGAPVLIEALAQLPAARAVLVGEGAQRESCLALARRLGVQDRIEWTGMLPHDQAIARMRACDVLASPHVPSEGRAFFGSPTKIFEFMGIGRPLVASALDQVNDVLDDGRTARLVRPGDVDDLARGLRDVIGSADCGCALGLAARAEVEAYHTWDHRAEEFVEYLRSIGTRLNGA